jgi:hypothetical protein
MLLPIYTHTHTHTYLEDQSGHSIVRPCVNSRYALLLLGRSPAYCHFMSSLHGNVSKHIDALNLYNTAPHGISPGTSGVIDGSRLANCACVTCIL